MLDPRIKKKILDSYEPAERDGRAPLANAVG